MEFIEDSRVFIAWYLRQHKKRKTWRRPTVGRLDHTKGYFFGNIELQEASENTAERNARYTKHLLVMRGDSFVGLYKSVTSAAKSLGVSQNNISACAQHKGRHTLKGYSFYYVT